MSAGLTVWDQKSKQGSWDLLWVMYPWILSEIPGIANEKIRGDMVDAPGEGIDTDDWEQSQAVPIIQTQDITGIEFAN